MRPTRISKTLLTFFFLYFLFQVGVKVIPSSGATNPTITYVSSSAVNPDGSIGSSEYGGMYHEDITGIDIHWEHNDSLLRVGLVAPGMGWVAIGFRSTGIQMDGDIIIGYVSSTGDLTIEDNTGSGTLHSSDFSNGGTNDITYSAGTESGGETTIEFAIPMDSGDIYDEKLVPGSNIEFFLALHTTVDNLVSYHTSRSSILTAYIEAEGAKSTEITLVTPVSVFQEEKFILSAKIEDEDASPVTGANISFYLVTVFGDMELGSVLSNSSGIATTSVSLLKVEETTIKAAFAGTETLLASSDSNILTVYSGNGENSEVEPYGRVGGVDPSFFLDYSDVFLVTSFLVGVLLGTIFTTYLFIVYNVFRISRQKTPEENSDPILKFRDIGNTGD